MFWYSILKIRIAVTRSTFILFHLLLISILSHPAIAGVNQAYEHEFEVMDRCNDAFYVYADQDNGCNHFYPTGWMGSTDALVINSGRFAGCYSGTSCMQISFTARGNNWSAVYWQDPQNNWGTVPDGGYDLRGVTELTFFARGLKGGEKVEFFVGGIQGTAPDSLSKTSTGLITLGKRWRKYSIRLVGKDLKKVIGGFGFALNAPNNPAGAKFLLDEVKYDLRRPNDLRFLRSFEPLPMTTPDMPDRTFGNASFIYDQALALLSFMARGTKEDFRRAKIIADSFLLAQKSDRYYSDGRLRNAYMDGDLTDHLTGKARLPGWWDASAQKWYEDRSQVGTSTGNLAWTMIALLHYYKKIGGDDYLLAAITLGEWIERETRDDRCNGGYTGGYDGWEPSPAKITWKATEHATDLFVAFMLLYESTGEEKWKERAQHAKGFITAMWDEANGHFWTGTLDDGCTLNESNIPVDIQAWVFLALGNYSAALSWAEENCYTVADGFEGFDFNNDRDGVWPEGTAQMSVAYQADNQRSKADSLVEELRKIQASGPNSNEKGIVAASHDGVSTGFDWEYFSRLHIGATAWYIFSEMHFNPYWATSTNKAKVVVNEPVSGNYVPWRTWVSGTVKPVGTAVSVIVHPVKSNKYHVQKKVSWLSNKEKWKVLAYIGGKSAGIGQSFQIRACANPVAPLHEGDVLYEWPECVSKSKIIKVKRK